MQRETINSGVWRSSILAALFLAGICLLPESSQASDHPDLGELFVTGVNDTSLAQRRQIVGQIYSSHSQQEIGEDRLVGFFARVHGDFGLLEYHHSEVTGEYLHLYARSVSNGQWHDFQFSLLQETELRLGRIVFIAEVAEPVYLPNGSIDNPHTLDWLGQYVEKLSQANDLAASVLIARGDSIIFERYVGFADAARSRPIGPHTRMNLGSGNKMFTALAVMQLRDGDRLSLTDTLVRYFPEYPFRQFISSATVSELLSHTSGLGDYWTDAYEAAWDSISTLDQMMPFVLVDTPTFAPGSQFQYSNSGFILAGKLVEKLSGTSYFDFVRDRVFLPLGMRDSDSYLKNDSDTLLAVPLTRAEGGGWKVAKHGLRGSSAGGGYSTTHDMLRFFRGLLRGDILKNATLEEMTQPRNLAFDSHYPYGYGFGLSVKQGQLISFGHGGQASGINFEGKYYPEDDITIILFSNQDNGAFDDLRRNIDKLVTGDR